MGNVKQYRKPRIFCSFPSLVSSFERHRNNGIKELPESLCESERCFRETTISLTVDWKDGESSWIKIGEQALNPGNRADTGA
jgi:hypothetical protein